MERDIHVEGNKFDITNFHTYVHLTVLATALSRHSES